MIRQVQTSTYKLDPAVKSGNKLISCKYHVLFTCMLMKSLTSPSIGAADRRHESTQRQWAVVCFRRSDSEEWREWRAEKNNKRAGIEKESGMSIAEWRAYFYCRGIRPTQLVDWQLIMYFFFILRLLNIFFW